MTETKKVNDLFLAIQNGNLEKVKQLHVDGLDMEVRGGDYFATPLLQALLFGKYEITWHYISSGANVFAETESDSWTSIMCAVNVAPEDYNEEKVRKIVLNLMELGVDINHKDRTGMTAIDVACCKSIADFLESHGAVKGRTCSENEG